MKINVSIDDVSPHPLSSVKVLDQCFELIKDFPEIKFSLFIPIAYWRTVRPGIATQHPLPISNFPDFCSTLRNLPEQNFELCYHGLFHGIPGVNDNDEFHEIKKDEAIKKFQTMFEIVKMSNLNFKPIFRPPAWRMSSDAIDAAKFCGIKTLALSPKEYAKKTYGGNESIFESIVYYNCNPPFDELDVYEKNEIVYHACEWDKNYLSIELRKNLHSWLSEQNNKSKLEFCFIEELA